MQPWGACTSGYGYSKLRAIGRMCPKISLGLGKFLRLVDLLPGKTGDLLLSYPPGSLFHITELEHRKHEMLEPRFVD